MKFINAAEIRNWDPEFGRKVVRMIITEQCPPSISAALRVGLREVQGLTNLDWDLVDKGKLLTIAECLPLL